MSPPTKPCPRCGARWPRKDNYRCPGCGVSRWHSDPVFAAGPQAEGDAKAALVRLHKDEYRALYRRYLKKRLRAAHTEESG